MVESKFGEDLVPKDGILPSLSGAFLVNLIWGFTEFKWLKRVSTCYF